MRAKISVWPVVVQASFSFVWQRFYQHPKTTLYLDNDTLYSSIITKKGNVVGSSVFIHRFSRYRRKSSNHYLERAIDDTNKKALFAIYRLFYRLFFMQLPIEPISSFFFFYSQREQTRECCSRIIHFTEHSQRCEQLLHSADVYLQNVPGSVMCAIFHVCNGSNSSKSELPRAVPLFKSAARTNLMTASPELCR